MSQCVECDVQMTVAEWAIRSQQASIPGLGRFAVPLIYGASQKVDSRAAMKLGASTTPRLEWYYLQADVPQYLLKDLYLHTAPFPVLQGENTVIMSWQCMKRFLDAMDHVLNVRYRCFRRCSSPLNPKKSSDNGIRMPTTVPLNLYSCPTD